MLENGSAAREHAGRVREMFGTIAGRYDLLNHLLSGNTDKRWRRIVASRVRDKLSSSSARVLDVACGTGDLSLTLFEITGAGVVGTDFCRPMLQIAAGKMSGRIRFIEGDALDLPFRDGTFDGLADAGFRCSDQIDDLVDVIRHGLSSPLFLASVARIPAYAHRGPL